MLDNENDAMRAALPASFLSVLILAGCSSITPREYLDPETAATVTVVAKPWTFMADTPQSGSNRRDFLDLYAFNINRTGVHRQYIAVMQSFFDTTLTNDASGPLLELETSDRMIALELTQQSLRQLGIAKPLVQPFARESRWWYFPVTKENLVAIAQSSTLRATLVARDSRISYRVFRDGSTELAELSATLP